MNFSLADAMNLLRDGRQNEAVDQLNKFIEYLQPFSPQTQLIATQLGIDIEFFRQVKYNEFQDLDPQVQALRFKYYAYKIAKWGMQIIQQKRQKVKRRHDLIEKTDQMGLHNEIGRTFGMDQEQQYLMESRLLQIQDKTIKRNKIHQKQLIHELEYEKKRTDYFQAQEERNQKLRQNLKQEYESKVDYVKNHLGKVDENLKKYNKKRECLGDELAFKRNELLHNAALIEEKIKNLVRMKEDKIDQMRRRRIEKKQRQHSLQEMQKHESEEYIQQLKRKLQEKRQIEFKVERRSPQGPRKVFDNYQSNLEQLIVKYEGMQPKMNVILSKGIDDKMSKKQFFEDKMKRVKENQEHLNTQRTFEATKLEEVQQRRNVKMRQEVSLKKEVASQRVQNFLQNRQQLQRLQSQQVERYNEYYSRQSNRLKNMRQSHEKLKSNVNQAILQANHDEEQVMYKMSRAIHLISDPDLQVQIKQNEKMTTSQKVAKRKQDEMQQLLRSFVTSEADLLKFSKSVTEVNKNEDNLQKL